MKIDFALLVTKAAEALRNDVAPHVAHDYARGQVYAVVSLLETLALRGDWSRAMLLEQIVVQRAALDEVSGALPPGGRHLATEPSAGARLDTTEDLFAELERGNRALVAISRWLDAEGDSPPLGGRETLKAKLEEGMRALNDREWRRVAPQMLALMMSTGGQRS